MAFMRNSELIPKDAVILDETEALSYTWDLIDNWKTLSDTWALRYGPIVLGSINACCGMLINSHYRQKLKLGNYGYFSSVLPISIMPAVMTALFHRHLVCSDILMMKSNCPICYELRSGVVQIGFGILYPMALAPTSALMLANRYSTYRVPDLKDGPKVMFKFLKTKTKPLLGSLAYMLAIELAASSIITYFEIKNNITLRAKLTKIEKALENNDL